MSKRLNYSIGSKKEDEDIRDEILKLINDRKNLNCKYIYIYAHSDEKTEDVTGIRFLDFWGQSNLPQGSYYSFLVKKCGELFAQGFSKWDFMCLVRKYIKHENLMERFKDIRSSNKIKKRSLKKQFKKEKLKEKLMPKYKPLEKDV